MGKGKGGGRGGEARRVAAYLYTYSTVLIPSLPTFLSCPAGVPIEPSSSGGALTAQAPSSEQALVTMTTVYRHWSP